MNLFDNPIEGVEPYQADAAQLRKWATQRRQEAKWFATHRPELSARKLEEATKLEARAVDLEAEIEGPIASPTDEDQLNRGQYAEDNFWDDRIAGHKPERLTASPTDDEREALYDEGQEYVLSLGALGPHTDEDVARAWYEGRIAGFHRRGPVTDAEVEAALVAFRKLPLEMWTIRMRAALEAARGVDYDQVKTEPDWEYGVQITNGSVTPKATSILAEAKHWASGWVNGKVLRRHPAGPWESMESEVTE